MKILEKSRQMTVSEMHKMTRSNEVRKMETAKGTRLNVDDFILFEDEKIDKKTGEVEIVQVLAVRDDTEVYATISPTFKTEFFAIKAMCEEAGEAFDHVDVCSGTSRNGRAFITCTF